MIDGRLRNSWWGKKEKKEEESGYMTGSLCGENEQASGEFVQGIREEEVLRIS